MVRESGSKTETHAINLAPEARLEPHYQALKEKKKSILRECRVWFQTYCIAGAGHAGWGVHWVVSQDPSSKGEGLVWEWRVQPHGGLS